MRGAQSWSWSSRDAELSLAGMDWLPVPQTPALLCRFSPPQALLQKKFLTPWLLFFPGFLPLPPWQSSSFICVRKSKQSTSLLRRWGVLSKKLTRDILESWPGEGKQAPQQTTQKSFLWQTLLCFSGQQEGLKSTGMSQPRHGRTRGDKLCLCHQEQQRSAASWTATLPAKKHPGNVGINFSQLCTSEGDGFGFIPGYGAGFAPFCSA